MNEKIIEIVENLEMINRDEDLPKNVRGKLKNAALVLQEQDNQKISIKIKINKSLQELDDIGDDPNLSQYARTQILGIVSSLESI